MKTIKFIQSKINTPTMVCTIDESSEYKLSEKCCKTDTIIYYDSFIIDIEASLINMDWCIITNPYDGEEYYEQCKKVSVENKKIFYGMEGTRCLLIDAVKIISTTNNSLEEVKQIIITEEMIEEYNSQPSRFMEEDLSE